MTTKHDSPSKTLGPRSALLVTALHERGRPIFSLADAQNITGLKAISARTLVHKLVARGWRRGFVLGSSSWFLRN